MQIEVPAPNFQELSSSATEPSSAIAERVQRARERQRLRFGLQTATQTNAVMNTELLRRHATPDADGVRLLRRAYDKMGLSARALHRIQKVSRTIADLAADETVRRAHVAEAIQYRALDRAIED